MEELALGEGEEGGRHGAKEGGSVRTGSEATHDGGGGGSSVGGGRW